MTGGEAPWKLSLSDKRLVDQAVTSLIAADAYEGGDYLDWVRGNIWGIGVNSENRITRLISCLFRAPSDELMWQAFNLGWDTCDAVGPAELTLLHLRLSRSPLRGWQFLDGTSAEFFSALPDIVTIYRGSSRQREHGVSWTTDLEVAQSFAQGHRGIRVPEAAVFSATMSKHLAWSASMERSESELILDPSQLADVSTIWTEEHA